MFDDYERTWIIAEETWGPSRKVIVVSRGYKGVRILAEGPEFFSIAQMEVFITELREAAQKVFLCKHQCRIL